MGGTAVFRLHAGNQEGLRGYLANGAALRVDGRPYCTCIPETLHHFVYPRFINKAGQRDPYQADIAGRAPYECKPLNNFTADGSRRFKTPHTNSCDHCADKPAAQRCCQQRTFTLTATDLGWYQDHPFGSPTWKDSWDRRNRVEGLFGILKNNSRENMVRGTHQFRGLTKVALAWAFRIAAFNRRQLLLWRERIGNRDKRRTRTKKNAQPTTPTTPAEQATGGANTPAANPSAAPAAVTPVVATPAESNAAPHKLRSFKDPKPG